MIDVRKDASRSMNQDPFARSDLSAFAFEDAAPAVSSGRKTLCDLAGDWAAIRRESPSGGWAFRGGNAYHSSFNKVTAALAIGPARNGVFVPAGAHAALIAYRDLQGACFAEIESGQELDEDRSGCKLDAEDHVRQCRTDDDKRHERCLV